MAVCRDFSMYDAGIAAKMFYPVREAEDGHRITAGNAILVWRKETPHARAYAKDGKKVAGYDFGLRPVTPIGPRHLHRSARTSSEGDGAACSVTQAAIHRLGENCFAVVGRSPAG